MSEQVQQLTPPQPQVRTVQYAPKVVIGISSYVHVDVRFATQLVQLTRQPWFHGMVVDTAKPIDQSRNQIVTKFLIDQPEGTHILFLDTDVLLPPNAVETLLSVNQPIVSGLIVQKMPPFYPLMNVRIAPDTYRFAIKWPENQVIAVDAIGMGACLIRRDTLQKFGPPWFSFAGRQSEDYYFCEHAQREVGYQILVDTRVVAGHIGDKVYDARDFYQHQRDELDRSKAMGVDVRKGS